MANQPTKIDPQKQVGLIFEMVRTLRLTWRLHLDKRVGRLPKLLVPAAFLYVLSPIDFIPDVIVGLGQLDDLAVVMIAIALFLELCPRAIVEEHRKAIFGTPPAKAPNAATTGDEDVVDGTYRVVEE